MTLTPAMNKVPTKPSEVDDVKSLIAKALYKGEG
jgi:hypothetical protein